MYICFYCIYSGTLTPFGLLAYGSVLDGQRISASVLVCVILMVFHHIEPVMQLTQCLELHCRPSCGPCTGPGSDDRVMMVYFVLL